MVSRDHPGRPKTGLPKSRSWRYPGVAKRDGDTLIIYHDGAIIQTLTPLSDAGKILVYCDSYILQKVLLLWNPATGRREPVASAVCYLGEFDRPFIVSWTGDAWPMRHPSASPDGRLVVSGEYGMGDHGLLTIHDWTARSTVARFDLPCQVSHWVSNSRFKAVCVYNTPSKLGMTYDDAVAAYNREITVNVWRDASGLWQMDSTNWQKPDHSEIPHGFGNLRPDSLPPLNPPLHFTGKPVVEDVG